MKRTNKKSAFRISRDELNKKVNEYLTSGGRVQDLNRTRFLSSNQDFQKGSRFDAEDLHDFFQGEQYAPTFK